MKAKIISVILLTVTVALSLFSCSGGYSAFLSDLSKAATDGDLQALLSLTDPQISEGAADQCKSVEEALILLPFYDGLVSTAETHIELELKYKSRTETEDGAVFIFCTAYVGVSGVAGKTETELCIEAVKRGGALYVSDISKI